MTILSELRPECDFSQSTDFIEEGLLDSLDIVAIVDSVDETYNISIPGSEILPENFSSIDAIVNLTKKYAK